MQAVKLLSMSLMWMLLVVVLLPALLAVPAQAEESGTRQLFSFETEDEIKELLKSSENVHIIPVLDAGVTKGKLCARITLKKGGHWAYFTLGKKAIKNWSSYDYFAMDLFTNETDRHTIHFELWDKLTRNYHTRCGFSDKKIHQGKQTVIIKINRAKRNGKEGRDWGELEPRDKIAMDELTKVKIFFKTPKDHDVILWVDNMRLMKEEAAFPRFTVPVPRNSLAFDFTLKGSGSVGCTQVDASAKYDGEKAYGFTDGGKVDVLGGKGWPDPLCGSFARAALGQPFTFAAKVPNGKYRVLLAGGPIYNRSLKDYRLSLKLNSKALIDEKLSKEEFYSEKHYYRFLRTQFSLKPDALWQNYINRMYQTFEQEIEVTGGEVKAEALNCFLSALFIVPAEDKSGFDKLRASIKESRIKFFAKSFYAPERKYPVPAEGEMTVFAPGVTETVRPWSRIADDKQKLPLKHRAARGQTVYLRFAVTPHKDLGRATIVPGDLKGPGTISAANARWYFTNYRCNGEHLGEGALLPGPGLILEKGITLASYIRLVVPRDAKPGDYKGEITLKTEQGTDRKVPVELTVYPFELEQVLPVSYGMYYSPRRHSDRDLREQLTWMREIGFTAVCVNAPRVTGINIGKKTVSLHFNQKLYDMVKQAGMGAHPNQRIMATALSVGRAIGRKLPGSSGAKVDQNPGIELKQPGFKELFLDAMRKYKAFIEKTGLPVAVEVVDEPREVPNPWNRNLADTIAYAKMQKEAGLTRFITPMADGNGGKDYRPLVDNTDIISIHAWERSAKLLARAEEIDKEMWFYNTGKDRYSWGFYNWRMKSTGRWEWHFRWPTGNHKGEYPGDEWHNPFTKTDALSTAAPSVAKYPGSMVFKSDYFSIAEGVNDYAFLYTLEQRITAASQAGKNKAAVKKAGEFLDALRKTMPRFPKVKGLEGAASGALLGKGLKGEAARNTEIWRRMVAEHIMAVSK